MLCGAWGGRALPRLTEHARLLQSVSEAAVVISLFCVGLRLPAALEWPVWRLPMQLASLTMLVTAGLIAGAATVFLGLSFPHALLLGAILAPTDPVLGDASWSSAHEGQHAVRFTLAAEGALSSALALPLVVFALALAGHYDAGPLLIRWVALDLLWGITGALALGWMIGVGAAYVFARLDASAKPGVLELLLLLCAVALGYGGAYLVHVNGLLAVLAAGSTLARGGKARLRRSMVQVLPRGAANVAGRIEQGIELAIVVLVGALLAVSELRVGLFLFALLVLVAARPIAARTGLAGIRAPEPVRRVVVWFGIRGIASLYYLAYAVDQGLGAPLAEELTVITLAVVATSIAMHALTALPLLKPPVNQEG